MSGEANLDVLFKTMSARLLDGVYVFATVSHGQLPEGLAPRMLFQEDEGTTVVLRREEAKAHGIAFEFPSRMISLDVHSSLDAVGFLARITTELAKSDMGVNPVSGFFHDHLFVPEGRELDAIAILKKMSGSLA